MTLKIEPQSRKVNQFKVFSMVTIYEKNYRKYCVNKVWDQTGQTQWDMDGQTPTQISMTGNHSKSRCPPPLPQGQGRHNNSDDKYGCKAGITKHTFSKYTGREGLCITCVLVTDLASIHSGTSACPVSPHDRFHHSDRAGDYILLFVNLKQ